MITYRNQNGSPKGKWNINVLLEGIIVGEIRKMATGYVYIPKGKRTGGETFPTLDACKASIEGDE